MRKATLNSDGGSRGNPGQAGLGFSLVDAEGQVIANGGWCLRRATNNVAEYSALIWGLKNALEAKVTHLRVCVDSELVAKQINGVYKVKNEDLKPLCMQARSLMGRFEQAVIGHVYRENNKEADRLANEAMDACAPVGSYLVPWEEQAQDLFSSAGEGSLSYQEFVSSSCLVKETAACDASLPTSEVIPSTSDIQENQVMEKNQPYTGPGQLTGESYEHAGGHYEMTIKDHFDAAHTLVGYDGPCRYLHGHTWDVEVTVAGGQLDEVGMLYDFKALKTDLHAVLENFDHRYINDVPPFDIINPTAEHLARVLYYELEKTLPNGIALKDVVIWESPNAKVVYHP